MDDCYDSCCNCRRRAVGVLPIEMDYRIFLPRVVLISGKRLLQGLSEASSLAAAGRQKIDYLFSRHFLIIGKVMGNGLAVFIHINEYDTIDGYDRLMSKLVPHFAFDG